MGSIELSFSRLQRENPNHSSYINFVRAISGRGLSTSLVFREFKRLVSKEDYAGISVDELLPHLRSVSQKTLIPSHLKIEDLNVAKKKYKV